MRAKISVELDGKTYTGSYNVKRGVVTVSTLKGHKSTQVGGSPPEVIARMLLRELVSEGKV